MKPLPGPVRDWVKTAGGQVIAVDEFNHRILIGDERGPFRIAGGVFRYPRSICVLDETAYVADSWNHKVQAFGLPEWKFKFDFGGFFCPSWITVANQLLVIADTNNRRLAFHRPDGSCVFNYEVDGFPRRVEVGEGGALIVHCDTGEVLKLEF